MAEPFLGQIVMFGGNFAPRGWAFCNGQLIAISQNTSLFSILGTTYGGDGRTTFALPDLRGRVAAHAGAGPGLTPLSLGEKKGLEAVSLNGSQLPAESADGLFAAPDPAVGAKVNSVALAEPQNAPLEPVELFQPMLGVHFIIALAGVYPSRS